jgi:hypothetical protein
MSAVRLEKLVKPGQKRLDIGAGAGCGTLIASRFPAAARHEQHKHLGMYMILSNPTFYH